MRGTSRPHVLSWTMAVLAATALGVSALQTAEVEWGYHDEIGPEHWGDLDPAFALCRDGLEQSPIDLGPREAIGSALPALRIRYRVGEVTLVHTGETIQARPAGRSHTITLDGTAYELLQFHWHWPSEHTVLGAHHPLEMHLVHRDASGRLAVIGVFIAQGRFNGRLNALFRALPSERGSERRMPAFNVAGLLPDLDAGFFAYAGSLTTPPCAEHVAWHVLQAPLEMSADQIAGFVSRFSGPEFPDGNSRPTRPLNHRAVFFVDRALRAHP